MNYYSMNDYRDEEEMNEELYSSKEYEDDDLNSDKDAEFDDLSDYKKNVKLTEIYLTNELKKIAENDRDIIDFSYKGIDYRGHVITSPKKGYYIFDVIEIENPSLGHKTKMFAINNMQQI